MVADGLSHPEHCSNFAPYTLKEIWSDAEKLRKSSSSLSFFQNVFLNLFWSSEAISLN